MIDPKNFRRINANYPISTIRATEPSLLFSDDEDCSEDDCCCRKDDESEDGATRTLNDDAEVKTRRKLVVEKKNNKEKYHVIEVEVDKDGNEIQKEKIEDIEGQFESSKREFTEEELLIASPVVLGFSFGEKLWLEFSVSGIKDIEWNDDAWDSLVLPGTEKDIIKALVSSHYSAKKEGFDDVIQGKGKGLVFVLHGTPGTGKSHPTLVITLVIVCLTGRRRWHSSSTTSMDDPLNAS